VTIKHRISVNLSEKEYNELSSLSEQYRVSMAWLGREAIEGLLEKFENEELQLPLRLLKKKET
jgi:hypothetical protein